MDIQQYIINNYGLTTKSIAEMSSETGYTKGSLRTLACKLGVKRNSAFKDFEDEIWKSLSVVGLSQYYVSNYGRIKSNKQLIKQQIHHQTTYMQVSLKNDNKIKKTYLVHKLEMIAFCGDSTLEIDHIDRNKQNNHISNLRYVTRSKNMNNTKSHSVIYLLTDDDVHDICQKLVNGMSISQIVKSNTNYTKAKVEKIKQKRRHLKISNLYF